MTVDELGRSLALAYSRAPERSKAVHVVLWGITNADALEACSIAEVVDIAGIGKWGPQVALGAKLSDYVALKS